MSARLAPAHFARALHRPHGSCGDPRAAVVSAPSPCPRAANACCTAASRRLESACHKVDA